MKQVSNHTWNIVTNHHACPKCGFMNESREGYIYRLGKYQKNVTCTRCQHIFLVFKPAKKAFGTLFSPSAQPEMEWEDNS